MQEFDKILKEKFFDPEMEARNETLRRVRASEIMATFAEYLNSVKLDVPIEEDNEDSASTEKEEATLDPLSKVISRIWGRELRPVNFTVSENYYPIRQKPNVALSAEVPKEFWAEPGGYIEAGTKIDVLWIETDKDDVGKLILGRRYLRIFTRKSGGIPLFRGEAGYGLDYFYKLHSQNPEDIFSEIFDAILWAGFPDERKHFSFDET